MMLRKIRYYSSVTTIYILTIGTLGMMLYASQLFSSSARAVPTKPVVQHSTVQKVPRLIAGKPVRITIPTKGIDLTVDEGHYDTATNSWTLSPIHAEFAVMTTPANNNAGTTFIYGHGTDAVFGKIGSDPPPTGTEVDIYTDNGHVFTYALVSVRNMKPTDMSILQDTSDGPPRLVVQTCTGALSEWRTMFTFSFRKVA
jgi:sortase (surface protein transpeptidase)